MLWLIFAALAAYFLYVKVYIPMVFWRKRGIPYAKMVPFFGNSLKMIFRLEAVPDTLFRLYNQFPEERYFGAYTFTRPALCVRDLDLIKQITVKDFEYFTDHLVVISKKSDAFMGGNLFSLKGNEWREMRATLSPAFTGSKMRAMFALMAECAEDFTNHFANKLMEGVNDIELKGIFTKYTNDVIASAAFGIKCDSLADEDNTFYKMGRRITSFTTWAFVKIGLYTAAPTLMNFLKVSIFPKDLINFFHNIVMETIQMREEQDIYRPDMIQLLMEARKGRLKYDNSSIIEDTGFATVEESSITKERKNAKEELSDSDITSQALIFFFAGFDASSTSMGFMMLELAINPDVQEKLRHEIDKTMAACNGKLTYEAIVKMKYLDQVVSETFRKWTPGFQADRVCVKQYTINPVKPEEHQLTIPEGTQILIPIRAIHFDPKYFPNPERFDPDRFAEENKYNIIPGSYFPFGVGPRNCIGSRFALLELKVMAVYLLHKFEIVVTEKTTIPIRFSKSSGQLAPEGGYWVGFKKRNS